MEDLNIRETFHCQCSGLDHMMVIDLFTFPEYNEKEIYIHLELDTTLPIYKRIFNALRYILGYTGGSIWSCTLIKNEDLIRVKDLIRKYEEA